MTKKQTQELEQLYALFEEYREAYAAEWQRLDKCERMYRGEHWHDVPEADANEPRPVAPIIHSTIENVRADLWDQYPEAIITADEPEHDELAQMLCAIVRENHINCRYTREYAKLTHDLTVGGYMIQETGYDPTLNRGLGGAFIRHVDARNIMFDPCCADIQESRAIFKFTPYPREWFTERYPEQAQSMQADVFTVRRLRDAVIYPRDNDSILLIECWRRRFDPETGRYAVHMLKMAGRQLLEDSRVQKEEGYFAHGEYPFVITCLFERKGSCLGYGIVDMFETQQRYSDKLDQIILKNALMASHNKLLVTGASGFDIDDLRDWSKEVHKGDNLNGVTWFPTAPLPAYLFEYISRIRESIKEESGSNDFSRGMTNNGVTAASAIAALQEMSSKRSRMAARAVHEAFCEAVRQEIEVEREFSLFTRKVAIEDACGKRMAELSPGMLSITSDLGNVIPLEFTVSVKVQRENRFSVAAHNELIFGLVKMGIITPDVALQMLMFDGKAQAISLMRKAQEENEAADELNEEKTQSIDA